MKKATECASNALKSFRMQAALRIDMDDPSVLVMMRQEGFEGVGIYLAVLLHLIQYPGCIARLSDVNYVGAQIRKRGAYMRRIINDYRLFRVTEDGKRFFSPYLLITEYGESEDGVAWMLGYGDD